MSGMFCFFGNFYSIPKPEARPKERWGNLMNQLSDTLKVIDGSSKDNFKLLSRGYGKAMVICVISNPIGE
jgi:hypothetical protein